MGQLGRVLVTMAICVWTLATAVFPYTSVRHRLDVSLSSTSGDLATTVDDTTAIPGTYLVAIARVRNRSDVPVRTTLTVAGVARHQNVGPGSSGWVATAWPRGRQATAPTLSLTSEPSPVVIETLEIANLYGFSRGLLNLVVVPARQNVPAAPWPLWLVTVGVALAMVVVPWSFEKRAAYRCWSAAGLVVLTLFGAAAISALVGPYRVGLAPRSYLLGLAILGFPQFRALWKRGQARVPGAVTVGVCGALCGLFYAGAMLQTLEKFGGNYSGFLHVDDAVAARAPFLQARPDLRRQLVTGPYGYDGQFMYLMAFDPFLLAYPQAPGRYRDVVDDPPYRYGRIGFSMLTMIVSGDAPERYPATMVWLIVGAELALCLGLAALSRRHGQPAGMAFWALAIPGFMVSLTFALPEALAAAGLVGGLYFWERRSWTPAVLCFASTLLVRETGIVLVATVLLSSVRAVGWRRVMTTALAIGAPVLLWRAYVAWRLFGAFGWHAVLPEPGDLTVPFAGFGVLYGAVLSGTHPASEVAAAWTYPVLLTLGTLVAVVAWRKTRGGLAAAAACYGLLAVSLNYEKIWMHVPSGERGTSELYLSLLLVGIVARETQPAVTRAVLVLLVALAAYTLLLSPEAAMARSGLLLIR